MGKTVLTDEMLEEILEERKTMTLEQLSKKWGLSRGYLGLRIGRYKDAQGIAPDVRSNERSIPIILYHEFGEVCEEMKRKHSPKRLSRITLVKER